MSEPVVTPSSIDSDIGFLLRERFLAGSDVAVVVLPARLDPDGVGVYRAEDLTSVKLLRAQGVAADFLHPPDQRTGYSEFSRDVVLAFAVGVAQNMTWDAAKATCQYIWMRAGLLQSKPGERPGVKVEVDRWVRDGDRVEIDGLSVSGLADETTAANLMQVLMGEHRATDGD